MKRMETAWPLILALMLLPGCVSGPMAPSPAEPAFYSRIDEGGSLDLPEARALINAYRAKSGLSPLTLDPELTREAARLAAAMAAQDRSTWGETPDPDHGNLAVAGLFFEQRSSAGYRTLAEAFSGWRDSPPHDGVMLARQARRLGLAAAAAPNSKYKVYWVMIVAGP